MDEPAEHAAHAADAPFLQSIDIRQADVQALGQMLLFDIVQVYAFDDSLLLFGQPFQDVADLFQQQHGGLDVLGGLHLHFDVHLLAVKSFDGLGHGGTSDGDWGWGAS